MPSLSGASHLALPVRDTGAGAEWYRRVLDLGRFVSVEHPDGIQFELWL